MKFYPFLLLTSITLLLSGCSSDDNSAVNQGSSEPAVVTAEANDVEQDKLPQQVAEATAAPTSAPTVEPETAEDASMERPPEEQKIDSPEPEAKETSGPEWLEKKDREPSAWDPFWRYRKSLYKIQQAKAAGDSDAVVAQLPEFLGAAQAWYIADMQRFDLGTPAGDTLAEIRPVIFTSEDKLLEKEDDIDAVFMIIEKAQAFTDDFIEAVDIPE